MTKSIRIMAVATLVAFAIYLVPVNGNATTITFDPTPTVNPSGGTLETLNDNYTVDGYIIEAFRATNVGDATLGTFSCASDGSSCGHFHTAGDAGAGATGNVEEQHYESGDILQGLYIRRADSGSFNLASLDYRVTVEAAIPGFSSSDVNILVATAFDPTASAASQFDAFSAGGVGGSYTTLVFAGFINVPQIFIASSGGVNFDNIVLTTPIPAALPLFLSALAALGLFGWRRRRPAG
jgi:hypothetical protein